MCSLLILLILAGQSDEFSFVLRRKAEVFKRRQNKIISLVVSAFSGAFAFNWSSFFQAEDDSNKVHLLYPATFDGRCIIYPNKEVLLDYMRWRQADCHINNLYNTTFHALIGEYSRYKILELEDGTSKVTFKHEGDPTKALTPQEAEKRLCGSVSADKNEILFAEYNVNYNDELEQFRKGTFIALPEVTEEMKRQKISKSSYVRKIDFRVFNTDIIGEKFWQDNEYLLGD